MRRLRLFGMTLVAAVAGCSLQLMRGGASSEYDSATDIAGAPPPIVQVRDFPRSSVVSIVAWDASDPFFGLRTSVSRKGVLVGGRQFGDHRLYMTPFYAHDMGGFKYAAVTSGKQLLSAGSQRDPYSCFYGNDCSPRMTVGVAVPDSLLRANRDSLVVTFFPASLEPWKIAVRRELVTAYLQKVDSLVAEMRNNRKL
jgi:hypothetical protein